MKHLNLVIHGDVQGVYFRQEAKRKADDLGVFGSVKNNSDGTVSIEVEGDNAKVDQFLSWANFGPSRAKVERVDRSHGNIRGYDSFDIDY